MTDYKSACFQLWILIQIAKMTASQGATVRTLVGQDANFSFQLTGNISEGDVLSINKDDEPNIMDVYNGNVLYEQTYRNRVLFTGIVQQRISFILKSVTLRDAGKYVVKIVTTVLGEQTLIVKASPSKPLIMELNIAESGSSYRLNCTTNSSSAPPGHGLVMIAEWKMNHTVISPGGRHIIQGTELTITNLSYGQDNAVPVTCLTYEDQQAKSLESDAHIIDVKYGPDNILLSPSSAAITVKETNQIIVRSTADCNPPCSFQWSKEQDSGVLTTSQSFVINSIGKDDAGRYTCTVKNNVTGRSKFVQTTVIVIYGPASDQVVLSPPEPHLKIEENVTVIINCSADCYPACNYTWTGPHSFYQTGTPFSRVMDRDKGGTYICTATNQENTGKTASANVTVMVFYGPGSSVNLGAISSTLSVDLLQKVPNITCSATCNPPCDYRWYKDGTFYGSGAILSGGTVEKSTRGNYICQAYNSFLNLNRSSSTSVNITVFYAPEVLLQPVIMPRPRLYIVKLGQTNVNLTCVVIDANPPVQHFIWTKDSQFIQDQTSQTFIITMVTRDTMGRWGCKGVNSKGSPLESTLDIDVHYGPVILNLPNVLKVERDAMNVTCIVDSRPPSSISWTKSQSTTFMLNKAELYIAHLNRSDKGTYECMANNTIQPTGQAVGEMITVKSNFSLDVTYGAGIVNLSVQDSNIVNENLSASFHCHVDSNPLPTITWRKDDSNTVLMTDSGVIQSQFRIESAQCLDMGNYSCTAYNGIWTPVSMTLQFFVICHPRTDFRSSVGTKVFGKRHTPAFLRYTVIAYPLPTFTWTFIGNGSETIALPGSVSQHDNGQWSEIRFTSLDIDQFGNYSVVANNSVYPSAKEVFEIIPADVPDVPSNVTVIDLTPNSVTIQWVAGYNGGPEQTFNIVASAGEFTRTVTASDPGYKKYGTAVLEGLLPRTKYSIYMSAKNSIGSSNMTEAIMIVTPEESTPVLVPSVSMSAVVGGIVAGVVVILLAVIAMFLWRRYQHRRQHSDGLVDNPVYDSSGISPGDSINSSVMGVEYAAVAKPKKKVEDPSSLYAQVDRNHKKGNKEGAKGKGEKTFKGGAKGKGGKNFKGDIYENAILSGQNSTPEAEYENSKNVETGVTGASLYENPVATSSNFPMVNKDGLLYADLMLDPPTVKNGKPVIRGIENRTEYADIAYGKRGDPLPDNDDEKEKTG